MRNRTEPNTVEKAVRCIEGFQKVYQSLQQQVALRGQSSSTLNSYIHRTALVALHFGKLPELGPQPSTGWSSSADSAGTFSRTDS